VLESGIMKELIELHHIKKHYPVASGVFHKKILARSLSNVNFTIYSGQTLSLVGESGSGKTTTTRLILLLEKPTEGHILHEGRDINLFSRAERAAYRKGVQAVFQDPYSSFDPRMRIADILSEPLVINTQLSRKERLLKVDELLSHVGLDSQHKTRYSHEFSGGQLQRIAIARALSLEPRLLVLDEPVSSLDVSIRGQILNLFYDLQKEKEISYLYISHDIASVRYLSHTIAVLYFGKIVEIAPSEVIFENSLHPYTQALLKASVITEFQNFEEYVIPGEIPSILHPPAGCPFHDRCPYSEDICESREPGELQLIEPGHYVACHRYNDYSI
jgi:peptide/nickel transport system ATP-binding protein/oligopeptide transport system ATP-binding protein